MRAGRRALARRAASAGADGLALRTGQVEGARFALPGGKLKPGEDEVEGLKRKLRSKLAPAASSVAINWEARRGARARLRRLSRAALQVGECVANWWRPDFEAELYPYVAPHITRPKESKRVFVVHLPEKCYFAVRRLPGRGLRRR